jgi:DNA/RNA endonuclease YhcR with UshA esterase domain
MLENKKLLILVVAGSLIGVLCLFLYSSTIKPVEVNIDEIDDGMVGKMVMTTGMITYTRSLSDDSLSILLTDLNTDISIRVYLPARVTDALAGTILTPGAVLEVVGEVELYGDEVEITVNSADGLNVVSTSVNPEFELWQILESVEVLEYMNLTTSGIAYDIDVIESSGELIGTSFVITSKYQNATYSLDCIFFDEDLSSSIGEGDRLTVTGVLEYYEKKGCWQLILNDVGEITGNNLY